MKQLSRVVWSEGMHLAQHHFQLQSRYFEDAIHFAVTQLFPAAYGVSGLELDAEALVNGTVELRHARGLMPDGLAFNLPESDPAPAPRLLADVFSPTRDSHVVHLTVPALRRNGANAGGLAAPEASSEAERASVNGNGSRPRFQHEPRMVADETLGHDERMVGVGRKNLRLKLDDELDDDEVVLPLARICRDGMGNLVYDPAFIPPLLQVGASARLLELVQRTIEMLEARAATLVARRATGALSELAANEVAGFWLLHTIHASLPALRHHIASRRTRPDELYVELARLGGALCTFALQAHPRDLARYDHDRLEETFGGLERHIREHLDVIIPDRTVTVRLTRDSAVLHGAALPDARAFGAAQWILAVRGALSTAELARRVPHFCKICSRRWVGKLVEVSLDGLVLQHIPSPPAAIAPRSDTAYFAVAKAGQCWESILKYHDIGVYVPDAVPDAEVELVVLLPG